MKKTLLYLFVTISSVFFIGTYFVSAQECPSELKNPNDTLYVDTISCNGKCPGSCYQICNQGYGDFGASACPASSSVDKNEQINCNGTWVNGDSCEGVQPASQDCLEWDASRDNCIRAVDYALAKKECLAKGLVWEPLTNKCTSGSAGGPTGSGSTGGTTFTPGASSQGLSTNNNQVLQLLGMLQKVLNVLVPLLIGAAVLSFFWFIVLFIWKGADNATERDKMKSGILWSIAAIFVMVSVWGIIAFIGSVTGIQQGGNIHGFKLPGQQ